MHQIFFRLDNEAWKPTIPFYVPLERESTPTSKSNHYKINWRKPKKMLTAFVLINTEIGSESDVLEQLKKVEGVEEAYNLWGVYDIIASVKADTMDKLTSIITKKIENIGKVNAKLTMITTEAPMSDASLSAILRGTSPVQTV
jgi:DNA-binding Lrp family transcriptional regulator